MSTANAAVHSPSRFNPWPYGIAAGLGVVIVVNILLVRIAAQDPPLVESDKPYEAGEAYQQEIEAFRASAALGWKAQLDVTGKGVRLALLDAAGAPVAGLRGAVVATRPERKDRDQTLTLEERSPGVYEASGALSPSGVWRLRTSLGDGRGTFLDDRRAWVSP